MTLPDFSFEKTLWEKGYKTVCGVDEVGRGSFAGPVFAGAVVFSPMLNAKFQMPNVVVNDSKKLSEEQRTKASVWIKENSLAWGVGMASVLQINKLGIKKATEIAFRNAIKACGALIDFLLVDAFYVPNIKGLSGPFQKPIIKGDTKSFSIAASSIIAKVERDLYMQNLSGEPAFSVFDWKNNKGYGTKTHREALAKHGSTIHHRSKFIEKYL